MFEPTTSTSVPMHVNCNTEKTLFEIVAKSRGNLYDCKLVVFSEQLTHRKLPIYVFVIITGPERVEFLTSTHRRCRNEVR